MNKYIRIVEQEMNVVKDAINRYKGVGCYYDNCVVWGHHLAAYEKVLDQMLVEAKRKKPKPRIA